jgi:hypothetical protein
MSIYFSKAAMELQMDVLKPHEATGSFSKASWGVQVDIRSLQKSYFL